MLEDQEDFDFEIDTESEKKEAVKKDKAEEKTEDEIEDEILSEVIIKAKTKDKSSDYTKEKSHMKLKFNDIRAKLVEAKEYVIEHSELSDLEIEKVTKIYNEAMASLSNSSISYDANFRRGNSAVDSILEYKR